MLWSHVFQCVKDANWKQQTQIVNYPDLSYGYYRVIAPTANIFHLKTRAMNLNMIDFGANQIRSSNRTRKRINIYWKLVPKNFTVTFRIKKRNNVSHQLDTSITVILRSKRLKCRTHRGKHSLNCEPWWWKKKSNW